MKIFPVKSNRGFTLIELLIVVAIIGVLAAIAIPSYTNYMIRARRADAKTALEQLRAAQEMRRSERGSFSTSLAELQTSYGVPTVAGPPGTPDYAILLNSATATGFLGQANPTSSRQITDGSLFIDSNGTKTPPEKWAR
jgi:type IV pilus assembly protein PilE